MVQRVISVLNKQTTGEGSVNIPHPLTQLQSPNHFS